MWKLLLAKCLEWQVLRPLSQHTHMCILFRRQNRSAPPGKSKAASSLRPELELVCGWIPMRWACSHGHPAAFLGAGEVIHYVSYIVRPVPKPPCSLNTNLFMVQPIVLSRAISKSVFSSHFGRVLPVLLHTLGCQSTTLGISKTCSWQFCATDAHMISPWLCIEGNTSATFLLFMALHLSICP